MVLEFQNISDRGMLLFLKIWTSGNFVINKAIIGKSFSQFAR